MDDQRKGIGSASTGDRHVRKAIAVGLSAAVLVTTVTGTFVALARDGRPAAFTRGTVALSVSPSSAAVSFDGMAPGDRRIAPLTVSNVGTLPLRYAVVVRATSADSRSLAEQLDLTIKSGVATCVDGSFAADGDVLYGPADLGSETGIDLIGDPTPGQQRGDRILDAGDSEVLCTRVALPLGTGDAFQGASTSATFSFEAEPATNDF